MFTTHPATDLIEGDDWGGDAKPGYWTGEASIPRSVQFERTGIHIYQPAWNAENVDPILWDLFGYEDYTHAFVPQDRFDETVRVGRWTFARKDDGFIGLWSWREPEWRVYDPAKNPMAGMTAPYDLMAPRARSHHRLLRHLGGYRRRGGAAGPADLVEVEVVGDHRSEARATSATPSQLGRISMAQPMMARATRRSPETVVTARWCAVRRRVSFCWIGAARRGSATSGQPKPSAKDKK